ncbi:hypothetical protein ACFSLT_19120 [Novosphingobium resinovorum]
MQVALPPPCRARSGIGSDDLIGSHTLGHGAASGLGSTASTGPRRSALSRAMMNRPTGPQPWTAKAQVPSAPDWFTAWTATASGSVIAATSVSTLSGTASSASACNSIRSAKAPL